MLLFANLKLLLKSLLIVSVAGLLTLFIIYQVAASPTMDDCLIRIEITSHHGDRINVSFPLSLLNTVHDLMPSDIREICGELNFQPKEFINEFNQMAGQDIVNIIQNEDQIRIWADPVDQSKTKKELGFLRVQVSEANHRRNFQVSVPRGFIQLAGKIVKNVGIVDRFVELPPEIKHFEMPKIQL